MRVIFSASAQRHGKHSIEFLRISVFSTTSQLLSRSRLAGEQRAIYAETAFLHKVEHDKPVALSIKLKRSRRLIDRSIEYQLHTNICIPLQCKSICCSLANNELNCFFPLASLIELILIKQIYVHERTRNDCHSLMPTCEVYHYGETIACECEDISLAGCAYDR